MSQYREAIVRDWNVICIEKGVPCSAEFSLIETLSNSNEIREWTLCGLPIDNYSVENAIIVKNASRYPLLIDPQGWYCY